MSDDTLRPGSPRAAQSSGTGLGDWIDRHAHGPSANNRRDDAKVAGPIEVGIVIDPQRIPARGEEDFAVGDGRQRITHACGEDARDRLVIDERE